MIDLKNLFFPLYTKTLNKKISSEIKSSTEKISSGLNNTGALQTKDLVLSEEYKTNKNAVAQLINELNTSITYLTAFDDGLAQTKNILDRMHTICLRASNETMSENEINLISVEIKELQKELTENAEKIYQLNNKIFLKDTDKINKLYFHYGIKPEDTYILELKDLTAEGLNLKKENFKNTEEIRGYLKTIEEKLNELEKYRNNISVAVNKFQERLNSLNSLNISLEQNISQLQDTDEAKEIIKNTKLNTHQKMIVNVVNNLVELDKYKIDKLLKF